MEGPSLVILSEELKSFVNKRVLDVSGNSKQDILRLCGRKIKEIKSWGKHLLIRLDKFSVRIHFLMFGSYRINEKKDSAPRLSLACKDGEINFYSCSVSFIEEDIDEIYDWKIDIMSDEWDEKNIRQKIKKGKNSMVCDVLMNQNIFAGVGNIIKNEVLFNLHLHPETLIKDLSSRQIKDLVKEARDYSFKFYEWKKIYELKKHWQIYRKSKCPRCGFPVKIKPTGKGMRRSFYCTGCQVKYKK
ncbi:MAG: endonuclease [Cytophagaceae bacterium]|nr:endonuclease [Cytophagaceae bacterium]